MAYEPRDGDRVQERSTGIKGFVRRCTRKPPRTGHYYRVRLVNDQWIWPDKVIAESDGPYMTTCVDCGIQMKSQAPNGQGMCVNCEAREGQRSSRELTGSATFARLGPAPRFTPAPVRATATPEQRERIDRGRTSADDSPF